MKTNLIWPRALLLAWVVTAMPFPRSGSAASCPISLRTSPAFPDSSGAPISAWVTAEGVHRTIHQGRVWRVGRDSLEFAGGYSRVSRNLDGIGWRADTTWHASRDDIALLFRGTRNRALAPTKVGHGALICGYVTPEGRYCSAEGASAFRLGNGDLELVWKAGGTRAAMRAADPMHRRIVPRDSVALVYAERAKGDSNLKGLFLAAGVAWAVFVIREAMKPKIEIEFDMPKIMPGT